MAALPEVWIAIRLPNPRDPMPLSPREESLLAALTATFERTWVIAARAGLTGPKAADTAATFLTALAGKGLAERGGTRGDATWRKPGAG
jgi:hypothetical protein